MQFWHKKDCIRASGFAIPELIVALVIGSVVVIAASQFSTSIHRTSKQDLDQASNLSKTDSALDLISEEINQADVILTSQSELPTNCGFGSGQFFLAVQLPPQAYLKSDYNSQTTSKGVFSKASQNQRLCPIVFGIKSSSSAQNGPYVLYRYGPSVNEKGFYKDTAITPASSTNLLEGISPSVSGGSRRCDTGWSRIQVRGLEACIDKYKKFALLSVSKQEQTATANRSSSTKRSGSGTARSLHSSLIPGVASSSGGTGGTTSFFGQSGPCDGTTFLIDKSGSMGWSRMQRAKNELLAAVSKCADGARINIMSFSSRYYSFSNKGNVSLDTSSRAQINNFINNIYAGGWTNPWGAMDRLMKDTDVKRVVLLTDGYTNTSGRCIANGRYMDYASCYASYNLTRQNNGLTPVQIDSVALDTSCSNWLGPISVKNGGSCVRA